jgi:hypothetical protein
MSSLLTGFFLRICLRILFVVDIQMGNSLTNAFEATAPYFRFCMVNQKARDGFVGC